MAIRTILVPMSGGASGDTALDAAIVVGRRAGAHVEALHVAPDPRDAVPMVGDGASASMIQQLIEAAAHDAERRAERARAAFDVRVEAGALLRMDQPPPPDAATRALTLGWRHTVGREDEVVASRGRLFDLIVVGRPGDDADIAPETTLEAALMESGRPVLVSPPVLPSTLATRVAIAWNGSTAAARAVASSGPFLAKAQSVLILEGDGAAADGASAEELAAMLAWRGLAPTIRRFRSDEAGIGPALLDAAAAEAADLLVMGGYGHNRLREMIFGGATIDAMFASNLPLLMTH
ncbi:universal stress protein [Stella sp.]|uniref:universal stress protein n=1 Tax=Stella sp. TaxID=2912054 RepID=UPI0035B3D56A